MMCVLNPARAVANVIPPDAVTAAGRPARHDRKEHL